MPTRLDAELTELLAVDVSTLSVAEQVTHMARLERARTRFEATVYEQLARFDRSAAWQIDAAYSPANWLAAHTGTARAVAGSRMRLATHLTQMPATMAALAEGDITEAHARVLARGIANPRVRDAFLEQEPTLVDWARSCPADELSNRIDAWIELTDQDGAEPLTPDKDVVHANRVGDRVKIDADLGLETGLPVLAALTERTDQLFRRDHAVAEANPEDGLAMRTPGVRRAEALVELILEGAGADSNPRRRDPLLVVHVDEETFFTGRRHADTICEMGDGTVVPIDVMRRWREGSAFQALVRDAQGAVLYLGREERYANRAQRRALAARDKGCAVPGCNRPPWMCDAHHVIFWEDFGLTDIDNLVLLCRYHHRTVHTGMLRVEMVGGVPRFFDSLGQRLREGRRRSPDPVAA